MVTLMQHQIEGADALGRHPRYALWWDCGLGKTITVLAQLDAAKKADIAADGIRDAFPEAEGAAAGVQGVADKARVTTGPRIKTLVVCPKSIMRNAWERDAQHYPGLKVVVCWAAGKAKRSALIRDADDADLLVINPENFKSHRGEFYRDAKVRRLIVDESSMLKNRESKISKAAVEFGDYMDSVWLLSGTPAPNCATEFWPQYRAMDKAVLGDSFYRFASIYFAPQKRSVRGKTVTVGYTPIPQRQESLQKKLKLASWSLKKHEAIELPDQVDVRRNFDLSPPERQATRTIIDELKAVLGDGSVMNVKAESAANKLRQLAGGWMYDGDKQAESFGNSKLNELAEVLDEIGPASQCIIWADFRHDVDMIRGLLESRSETFEALDGRFTGDTADVVTAFQAGKLQRLICHPQSVGHGVTLTAASYAVFYSLPWSYEYYKQARDRIHRAGQNQRCTYYHLIGTGTLDEAVLWAVRHKGSKSEAILKALGRGDDE